MFIYVYLYTHTYIYHLVGSNQNPDKAHSINSPTISGFKLQIQHQLACKIPENVTIGLYESVKSALTHCWLISPFIMKYPISFSLKDF